MVGAILPRRKGLLHGAGSKSRTANAKHQHMPIRLDTRDERGHFHFQLGAERQGKKGQLASCQLAFEPLGYFRSARLEWGRSICREPMRIGPGPFEHMRHEYLLWGCAAHAAAHYKSRKSLGAKKRRRTAL